MTPRVARIGGPGRYLPAVYFALSLAAVAALLPTALRPPPQAPPTSAQLSPDAPPDDMQVVVSDLGRAQSTTAGATVPVAGEVQAQAPPVPEAVQAPRRGRCFGNPPRQTESLYSAPCAPAFTGTNPGATSKGVDANEFRVGVVWGGSYDGPVKDPHPDESAAEVRFRTWQAYFNERYELYGRRMRLILIRLTGVDPAQNKSQVAGADSRWPLFGFFGASLYYPALEEALRRKIVSFDSEAENAEAFYRDFHPYVYSWRTSQERSWSLGMELACKQFVGRPPEFNERRDLTFDYTKPRKFGLIAYEENSRRLTGAKETAVRELAKCGGRIDEYVRFNLYDEQSSIASAVTKMRASGITTIFLWTENLTPIAYTQEAFNQGYFPEWFNVASTWQTNGGAQLYQQDQWRHAVSTFSWELPRPEGYDDCSIAYRSQNPDGSPGECGAYRVLQQYANGVQGAGPTLDPETFFAGLKKTPCRPPVPEWSIGGCYKDGDLTYPDYVALGWWDPRADPPDDGDPGAYRFLYDGKRFGAGEIPTQSPWFKDGITTPKDPSQSL